MKEETLILQALRMEWHLAWRDLPDRVRRHMRLPGFEIRDLERRWGSWNGARKRIILANRLIQTSAWPCIREVLRHEMAHQLTDEVFHADEPSHGPRFREACRLLNADPRASGDLPSIYQWIHEHDQATDPRVEKIRKLLALAASPHPHEAEAAMLKAHEWMTRYNIDPVRPRDSEYVSLCIGDPALRHSAADDALASILRDFYFVETLYIPIAVPGRGKPGKIVEISGTRENVRMASYIADFLRRSIREQVKSRRIRLKRVQDDYAQGFLKGVRDKLAGQQAAWVESVPETAALIRKGDEALRVYFRKRYPRLRTRYLRGRRRDEDAYHAGIRDGRSLVIHKPVEAGPTAGRRLLTSGG